MYKGFNQGSFTEEEDSVRLTSLFLVTSLAKLIFLKKLLFTPLTKQATLMGSFRVLSLPLS
jgi:hypothetical protein